MEKVFGDPESHLAAILEEQAEYSRRFDAWAESLPAQDAERKRLWGNKFPEYVGQKPPKVLEKAISSPVARSERGKRVNGHPPGVTSASTGLPASNPSVDRPTRKQMSDAIAQGIDSKRKDLKKSTNPYPSGSILADSWLIGFNS